MKRYISLALAAVVLVVSLAVPSYAAETGSFDNFDYINVLDYTDLGICWVSGSDPYLIDIPLPSSFLITYVDFILLDRTGGISSVDFVYNDSTSVPLTVVSLGSNYYRIYGDVLLSTNSVTLRIDHGNGGFGWFDFCSFYISTNSLSHFEAPLVAQGFTPVSDVELSLHAGDNRPVQVVWSIDDFSNRAFSFSCYSPDWYKYDYLDFQVIASVSDISSISAVFGEITLPFSVSKIYGSNTDDNPFCVSIRLDMRGLDRSSGDVPEVTITGQSNYDGANGFLLAGCSGYVVQRDVNPLFYYFKKLTSDLSVFFSNLGSSIESRLSVFHVNMLDWFNLVNSNTIAIYDRLAVIRSNMIDWFDIVNSNIIAIYDRLAVIRTNIIDWFDLVNNNIITWYQNIISSISSWGQNIVDAINGDASDADEFKQQVDDSNKELNDMAAVMDSFTAPDVNSINVDVGSYISPTDLTSLTAPMGMLFESNIVTTCIMISIIMGTVMFVLYGKR